MRCFRLRGKRLIVVVSCDPAGGLPPSSVRKCFYPLLRRSIQSSRANKECRIKGQSNKKQKQAVSRLLFQRAVTTIRPSTAVSARTRK